MFQEGLSAWALFRILLEALCKEVLQVVRQLVRHHIHRAGRSITSS